MALTLRQIIDLEEQLNKEARKWAQATRKDLKRSVAGLGLKDRVRKADEEALLKSLGYGTRSRDGMIERIFFKFARHGIFLEVGAGRGRPVRSAKANMLKRPWIIPTLKPAQERLANRLATEYADIIEESIALNIYGGGLKT